MNILIILLIWAIVGIIALNVFNEADFHPSRKQMLWVIILCGPITWFIFFVVAVHYLTTKK